MSKCTDCRYCIEEDWGYSNYTVEGTEVNCLLNKNPDFPTDRFYGENEKLNFAATCDGFVDGESIHIDVEKEEGPLENYSDDEDIKLLLREYED